MGKRSEQKRASRERILKAAARRLRLEGLAGMGVHDVMTDAGLTRGAFYAHFPDKNVLSRAALQQALIENRNTWTAAEHKKGWRARLETLAKRYLTPRHRQNPGDGCALAALCSEAARTDEAFREHYEQELRKTLAAVCERDISELNDQKRQEAVAFMSLMVGSLTLSRAVSSEEMANLILSSGQAAAARLANPPGVAV
jgi:TetR/AcrR family transcriptional repressor of nem operon